MNPNKLLSTYSCILILTWLIFMNCGNLFGQSSGELLEGEVSYITPGNVYVKFKNTDQIKPGDSLYILLNGQLTPAVLVRNKSSRSCVGPSLVPEGLALGTKIMAKATLITAKNEPAERNREETVFPDLSVNTEAQQDPVQNNEIKEAEKSKRRNWRGRLSLASHSNFNESPYEDVHRFQYTLSLNGSEISGLPLSFESYISFRHKAGEWDIVENNINDALKIYNLSVAYKPTGNSQLSIGRRINRKISNLGAIDGLQFSYDYKNFQLGGIVGSRPELKDYSINLNYFEWGMYLSHNLNETGNLNMENTIGVIDQKNHGKTDRRLLYIQHSGTLFRKLNLFGSAELDFYQHINGVESSDLKLTNMYFSMRYRFVKRFNVSVSYDNRTNVIYYETYKNDIDRLLEEQARQGIRIQMSIQPIRYMSVNFGTNIRLKEFSTNESINYNVYISHSRIPYLNCALSLSGNYLVNSYLKSKMFGIQLSKDFLRGKLYCDLYFRSVLYQYRSYENSFSQQLFGGSLNLRMTSNLNFGLYAEKTLDFQNKSLRLNGRIMLRF